MKKNRILKNCLYCKKDIWVIPSHFLTKKYCSNTCNYANRIGKAPWNKGKKLHYDTWNKGQKGIKPWMNLSGILANSGFYGKHTPETKKKISDALTGRPQPWNRGEKSNFWKGGKSKQTQIIKGSLEYKNWRRNVFERDNYTCQMCQKRGGYLEADHILPKSTHPELIFELSNGRALCQPCHRSTDTFGIKQYNLMYKNGN